MCALRAVLNAAVEDGLIESNPATKVGRFAKSEKPARKASAMTRVESDMFLAAVGEICPEWHPLFLTALRAGLRKGELIALQWGDVQFGESVEDSNRYIFVQRNYSLGRFTTPKSNKSRRVDLYENCEVSYWICETRRCWKQFWRDGPALPGTWSSLSRAGTVIKPDNIVPRYMEPALEKAGLRHFRFHDLRHTFGSLLIQDRAPLTYVKEQMGHSFNPNHGGHLRAPDSRS